MHPDDPITTSTHYPAIESVREQLRSALKSVTVTDDILTPNLNAMFTVGHRTVHFGFQSTLTQTELDDDWLEVAGYVGTPDSPSADRDTGNPVWRDTAPSEDTEAVNELILAAARFLRQQ